VSTGLSEVAALISKPRVRIGLALSGAILVVVALGADLTGLDSSPEFGLKQVGLSVAGTAMLVAALPSPSLRRPSAVATAAAAWLAALLADPLGFGGSAGFGPVQILVAEASVIIVLAAMLRPGSAPRT